MILNSTITKNKSPVDETGEGGDVFDIDGFAARLVFLC
jgi:hypothetical protein